MIKTDTMTGVGLGEMQIGLEDVNLVDQGTVLQVKGVPVFVAPESMLRTDTYTGGVGLGEMEVGIDELKNLNVGLESEVVLQVNGVPVYVAPESMLRTDTITSVGVGKMDVGIDELKNLNVAVDSEIVMQVHGKPVGIKMMADNTLLMNPVENPPYNNWSTNQPNVPHDQGM
jgi:predicted transport protein